jgi:NAD(P)-dependent dehydrogenase (short-subunit alcohol dehydrogenase family)
MSRIFITGSSDGLGQMAAKLLVNEGHEVVVHGRNQERSATALAKCPGATAVVTGDLSSIKETIRLAYYVNALGQLDAVIHNAGIYLVQHRALTGDGLPSVFAVNSLSTYILTCLIHKPKRLIYTSSGMHLSGEPGLDDLKWERRSWSASQAYSDSKLHDVMLAFAVARKCPDVYANAIDPGWVPTKMGGPGAPESLEDAPKTQAWLAVSTDPAAQVSGKYFYHQQSRRFNPIAADVNVQERFLEECRKISGVEFSV